MKPRRLPAFPWKLIYFILPCMLSTASAGDYSPQEIAESQARLRQMESHSLDLQAIRQSHSENQTAAARARIINILKSGDIVLATHALTFLGYYPDPALEPALIARRTTLGDSWAENHLRISIDTFLAKLGQPKAQLVLAKHLQDPDPHIRMRIARVLRDIEPEKFKASDRPKLRKAIASALKTESDPVTKSAMLSALACWEPENARKHLAELKHLATASEGFCGLRAAIELNQLRHWEEEILAGRMEPLPGQIDASSDENPSFRQELIDHALHGGHAERMFSLELLAQLQDDEINKTFLDLGSAPTWQGRLSSAFYILLIDDKPEARKRLMSEEHPFVQLALLCTLLSQVP